MNIVLFMLAEKPGLLHCIPKQKTGRQSSSLHAETRSLTSGVISVEKEKELFLDLLLSSSCLYSSDIDA